MDQIESGSQNSGSNDMRNGVDYQAQRAGSTAHDTVDRLANAARPAVDRLADTAHSAVDRMTNFASTAASSLGQRREQLNTVSAELVDNARTYVKANPIAAISIAAAVGFVLSRMMRSR